MHPDVALVNQLQTLDLRIAALDKEVAELPRHIAVIEKTLDSHLRKLSADKAALAANQKDRKNLEGEVQLHQSKISKLRDQMAQAKTNEQFKAFQNEIDYAEKEIRKAEDRNLELLTASEPLDAAVKQAETALKQEQKQVEAEKAQARERTATSQAELDILRAEHKVALAALPKPIAATYERIRKKWKGTVAAEATGGRCTACQMVLRPQVFQDLRKGTNLMQCESCQRFLYYNPPIVSTAVDMT
ncbi:MAG: C4-type zinc ribbon domain-containing protein [Bryobacteraceae bacterium]